MAEKKLRSGYTTGTCAQAATRAAVMMLLTQKETAEVHVVTANGTRLTLPVEEIVRSADKVTCAVRKDSGDDPDVTNGVLVYSTVTKTDGTGIEIDGGIGIGRVTKPGLWQEIGEAAINKVPGQMIRREVEEACEIYAYPAGMKVLIEIPDGVELAKKTFNPRLGIEGGISVLGTSGIVEPMSEQALIDTIRLEMKMKLRNESGFILAAPGNYGLDFLELQYGICPEQAVKCSNYIGKTIDFAVELEAKGLLFAAHIGKFVKLSGGIMNTHSMYADCRMELLAAAALEAGLSGETAVRMLGCITTDDALAKCSDDERGALMEVLMRKIQNHLERRAEEAFPIGAIVFSNVYGVLGQTENARTLLEQIKGDIDER